MNINPKQFDITIECGADFSLNMAIRNSEDALVDLTGCTVSAQLREYPEASDYIAFTATHNGEGGKITLSMAHESTAQIGYSAGYYDCFVTFPDTSVQKVLWGEVTVIPAVTKPIDGTVMILLSFGSESAFPLSGLVDRIYFSHASSKMYRWNGTGYVGIRTEMEWDDINNKPETFPPSEHNHDDRYYQKSTVNTLLSVKANVGDSYTKDEDDTLLADKANADDVYTKSEVDTALADKADIGDSYTKDEEDALLADKADASDVYEKTEVDSLLSDKADADDVYTKAETDTLLDDKANTADLGSMSAEDTDDYYTKTATDSLLADKADIIHTSASGSLVSIHDGAPYPVDSLTVGIEPVQDLHGYDNPWPAGGGKNIFGGEFDTLYELHIPQGTTVTAFSDKISIIRYYASDGETQIDYWSIANSVTGGYARTFSPIADAYYFKFSLPTGETDISTKMYIAKENSFSGYAPYSNICPITGHTNTVVTRTGRNLIDSQSTDNEENHYIANTGKIQFTNDWTTSYYVRVKPNSNYVLSGLTVHPNTSTDNYVFYDANKNVIGHIAKNYSQYPLTTPAGCKYLRFCWKNVDVETVQFEEYPISSYAPYQGQTVTIDLDGTRYGGELNVLTGELTVDRAIVDLGTLSWSYNSTNAFFYSNITGGVSNYGVSILPNIICSIYKTIKTRYGAEWQSDANNCCVSWSRDSSQVQCKNTAYTDSASFVSAMSGIQLVYELAIPLTVQLTPSQLSLLLGDNNVWADTGDVAVEYRADTKLYIDGKFAELQALILEN